MTLTFLGTGTSHGIPVIGCDCATCSSSDSRDKRWRSSLLVESEGTVFIIDTGYELRLQLLRANVRTLDGVLYTHAHSDHLMGLDDLRVFCKDERLGIYAPSDILMEIKRKFPYAFECRPGCGLPQLDARPVRSHESFKIGSVEIVPIPVMHGGYRISGYRFGKVLYVTDVSDIMLEHNLPYLRDIEVVIIGALRERPHPTHYSFSEAVEATRRLNAKRVIFTHISHSTSHKEIEDRYKGIAEPAYDMLSLEV